MKEAVAGELAAAYDSSVVDQVRASDYQLRRRPAHAPPRPRIRVLLRRRPGGRLRLSGAAAVPGTERLPDRRNHPQPARQPTAARQRHPVPLGSGRAPRDAWRRRRGDPAGLRGHRRGNGAAGRTGLHARGYHLRLGAERLEERHPLRAGRLHRDHPRQSEARRNQGDRLAGAEVSARPLPRRARQGRSRRSSATTSVTAATARPSSPVLARRAPRASIPTSIWSASGAPTRRRC